MKIPPSIYDLRTWPILRLFFPVLLRGMPDTAPSAPQEKAQTGLKCVSRGILVYSSIALIITLPLLTGGYVLTLDMVFVPSPPVPALTASSYGFHAIIAVLSRIVPSHVVQKIMLFGILAGSGWAMHRLINYLAKKSANDHNIAAYTAGFLYMVNPYTYSRFMAGQYAVLLGYAILPFFAQSVLEFWHGPSWKKILRTTGWLVVISIVSIHTVGLCLVLIMAGAVVYCWGNRKSLGKIWAAGKLVLAGAGLFVFASCYWLVPLLAGQGQAARAIAGFGAGDSQAFATLGGNAIGKIGNLVRLQGFWAEGQGLFGLPQDLMPGWGLLFLAVWAAVIYGGAELWRRGKKMEVMVFVIAAVAAMIICVVGTDSWLGGLPLASGYREPQKFAGLLALVYAAFGGLGASRLAGNLHKRWQEPGHYAVFALSVLVIVGITPNMFWGFGGQLKPVNYPNDWYTVNQFLDKDQSGYKALFLPWHLYMYFDFAGRVIANPAPGFFGKQVIASNNPEFGQASPSKASAANGKLNHLLHVHPDNLAAELAKLDIKYVILAKETDYIDYRYLDRQKNLQLLKETGNLKLYINKSWKHNANS